MRICDLKADIYDLRTQLEAAEAEAERLRKSELQLRFELVKRESEISELRRRLANIARDASAPRSVGASGGQGVGPSASYYAMARALDRIATVASIGAEEGEP